MAAMKHMWFLIFQLKLLSICVMADFKLDFLNEIGTIAKGFLDHGCKYECYSGISLWHGFMLFMCIQYKELEGATYFWQRINKLNLFWQRLKNLQKPNSCVFGQK